MQLTKPDPVRFVTPYASKPDPVRPSGAKERAVDNSGLCREVFAVQRRGVRQLSRVQSRCASDGTA